MRVLVQGGGTTSRLSLRVSRFRSGGPDAHACRTCVSLRWQLWGGASGARSIVTRGRLVQGIRRRGMSQREPEAVRHGAPPQPTPPRACWPRFPWLLMMEHACVACVGGYRHRLGCSCVQGRTAAVADPASCSLSRNVLHSPLYGPATDVCTGVLLRPAPCAMCGIQLVCRIEVSESGRDGTR